MLLTAARTAGAIAVCKLGIVKHSLLKYLQVPTRNYLFRIGDRSASVSHTRLRLNFSDLKFTEFFISNIGKMRLPWFTAGQQRGSLKLYPPKKNNFVNVLRMPGAKIGKNSIFQALYSPNGMSISIFISPFTLSQRVLVYFLCHNGEIEICLQYCDAIFPPISAVKINLTKDIYDCLTLHFLLSLCKA